MRKRTRIAVVVAALLVAVVAPAVNPPTRQVAEAGTVNWEEVVATLDRTIPRTGWMRNGRPAFLAPPMRWRLEKAACTVNQAHDLVYEYQVDDQLRQLDLGDDAWRYQSALLRLSDRIEQWKQGAGDVYKQGSEWFCDHVDERLEQAS